MDVMDKDAHIYTPETLISPNTNKPVAFEVLRTEIPIYWCSACLKQLSSPITAHQHVNGNPHKKKVVSVNKAAVVAPSNQKRQLSETNNGSVVKESPSKKMKEEPSEVSDPKSSDPNLKCADCNLVFKSLHDTIQHFKHTKHQKDANPANQKVSSEQSNGSASKSVKQNTTPKAATNEQAVAPVESDVDLKCDICSIVFQQSVCAKDHFQGKRHAKALRALEAVKEREVLDKWQSRNPTVLSHKGQSNVKMPVRGIFARSMDAGNKQAKVMSGFVRATETTSVGSEQATMPTPPRMPNPPPMPTPPQHPVPSNNYNSSPAFVRPLESKLPSNPTYGVNNHFPVNMTDNKQQHSNVNVNKSSSMQQNTSYSTPPNSGMHQNTSYSTPPNSGMQQNTSYSTLPNSGMQQNTSYSTPPNSGMNQNTSYSTPPNSGMHQNTSHSTPPSFNDQARQYPTNTYAVQTKEAPQYQSSGYQPASNQYLPPPNLPPSNTVNNSEQSTYRHGNVGASNTQSQASDSYYSSQLPITASYPTPTVNSNYNSSSNYNPSTNYNPSSNYNPPGGNYYTGGYQ